MVTPITLVQKYFTFHHLQGNPGILHVAGENGAGKTTILLEIMKSALVNNIEKCIYLFDSEGKFTKERLNSLTLLTQFRKRIFHQSMRSTDHLLQSLQKISIRSTIPPHSLVVIHSLSSLIREDLAYNGDYLGYIKTMTEMNATILPMLISKAVEQQWDLILTHHVAFDPSFGENRPAFGSLMENVNGMWWILSKIPIGKMDDEIEYRYKMRVFVRFPTAKRIYRIEYPYKIIQARIHFLSQEEAILS